MIKISSFYKHHEEFRDIIDSINNELEINRISTDPELAMRLIRKLFARLTFHLHLEDTCLYPQLANSDISLIRDMSTHFQLGMEELKETFETYKATWYEPKSILNNPKAFINETHKTLAKLQSRMRQEESEFYEMIDKFEEV